MKKKTVAVFIVLFIVAVAAAAAVCIYNHTKPSAEISETAVSESKVSKYQKYMDKNSDFVGYIEIEGTHISYPVVQTTDNAYYLTHNFEKQNEERGAIYMDTSCNPDKLDFNTIIYGHNWLDTTMFSEIPKYSDIDFLKEHPIIKFDSAFEEREWKIFAVFITNADADEDNGYVFNYIYPHMNGDNFSGYMQEINKRSLYRTNIDVKETDKILTLSSCTREMDTSNYRADARIVVVARLVRDGEQSRDGIFTVTKNPDPKYPQLYCDILGKKNNYSSDDLWYPVEMD